MENKLDLKDRKILYQLDLDCRQSSSVIGRKVGLSKQVVDYRIKRLLENKVILRFASVIDTYKLGFSKYKVFLSLQNANKEKRKEIVEYLKKHNKTEWVATCSGKWDIIFGYNVKNVYEFNEAVKEFEEKYSQFVANEETAISLGVPHWRKEYLLENKKATPYIQQGGKQGNYKLDKIDEELIRILVNNARMSVVEIAEKLSTTARIINYRIKRLKKDKVILINRIFLNLEELSWLFCKAIIKFKNLNKKKYTEFLDYCGQQKNLTYLINSVGAWDVELDFEVEDFNKFNSIMLNIREKFADIIKNYDFVIILNEDKLDYYPGAYPNL